MDKNSIYNILVLKSFINKQIPTLTAMVVKKEANLNKIISLHDIVFNEAVTIDSNLAEKNIDILLNNVINNQVHDGVMCLSSSINYIGEVLPTGGIVGAPSDTRAEPIVSGKIYSITDDLHYFGFPGEFSVILECEYDNAFKFRTIIEDNNLEIDFNLKVLANNHDFKKVILTRDGSGSPLFKSNIIETYDLLKKEYKSYNF